MTMHNLELRICNWVLVGASMFLSGYYGYSLMLGEMPFAGVMFVVCAIVAFLVSLLVRLASLRFQRGEWVSFVMASVMAGIAIFFNIVSDYSSATILRDHYMTSVYNDNRLHENAVAEVKRLETAMGNLRAETAWRTKFEAPETYAALITEQKQRTDRGRNIYARTKQCTDTTLAISEQVCREIARLEAQKANAVRRQVILAELKTLGEQLEVARTEAETNKKMTNPALAQTRAITAWFTLDRQSTDGVDWWGGKSIMLYLTVLLTGLITILGWELGQHRAPIVTPPHPERPRNRWISSENHGPEPIPLAPADPPPLPPGHHTSNTVVYAKTAKGYDSEAIKRLMMELEEEFGLQPKH
jgi:hypothetical protein